MCSTRLREVLFEFRIIGSYIKVTAIDPVTGTEVTFAGDPDVGEEALKRIGVRKLEYVLARNRGKARGPGPNAC